jgi:hypothetical protein
LIAHEVRESHGDEYHGDDAAKYPGPPFMWIANFAFFQKHPVLFSHVRLLLFTVEIT